MVIECALAEKERTETHLKGWTEIVFNQLINTLKNSTRGRTEDLHCSKLVILYCYMEL